MSFTGAAASVLAGTVAVAQAVHRRQQHGGDDECEVHADPSSQLPIVEPSDVHEALQHLDG
jgi:hypothetical protein